MSNKLVKQNKRCVTLENRFYPTVISNKIFQYECSDNENIIYYDNFNVIDTAPHFTGDSKLDILIDDQLIYSNSPSEFVKSVLSKPNNVIDTLAEVIISLKRTQEYNSIYTAYLLNQLSEDEFCHEAEAFSYEPKTDVDETIKNKVKILFAYVNEKFTVSDISDIFQLDIEASELVLNEMQNCGEII